MQRIVLLIKQWILDHKILCAIILFGFLLRLIPILWGIPTSSYISPRGYHPDEPKVYRTILRFPEIYLTTDQFPGYGTTIQYILGLFLMPLKLFFIKFLKLPNTYFIFMWILSRFASILMGTCTIYFTYILANKVYGSKVAIISAAFVATSLYHTLNSSIITVDVAMAFMLVLNFLLSFKVIGSDRLISYVIMGCATGLLIGIKTVAGLFFIVPCLGSIIKIFEKDGRDIKIKLIRQSGLLLSYIITAIIVFLIFHPHILMDFSKYVNFYMREKIDWVDRVRGTFPDLISTWARSTSRAIGVPIALLALFGLFMPGKKNLFYKGIIILFLVLYFAFWRWFMLPRYLIAIAPLLCIFAAHMTVFLIEQKIRIVKITGVACIAVSLGYSIYCCAGGVSLRLSDTRPGAARYIDENIQAGTTIGILSVSEKHPWRHHQYKYPKVNFKKFEEVNFLEKPDVLIASSYDFEKVLETLKKHRLSSDYVLDKAYYKEWYRYSAPSPRIFKFYDDLFVKENSDYFLLKTFEVNVKVPIEFPPPEVRIYKKIR